MDTPSSPAPGRILSRKVWLIGLVSLFTDISSEMLYPIMPLFLGSIGFSVMAIGLLEGLAEATAGLSKGYFGKLSDSLGKRVPFVAGGYGLSAISKPMMAVFAFPAWIFFARTLDRLGKGLRTGARDAMLSGETTPEYKGRVFGFHRGMDTVGAAIGPLCALLFLSYFPGKYKEMFYYAFIPAAIGVGLTLLLRDKKQPVKQNKVPGIFSFMGYWKEATPAYRQLVTGLLLFTLFNSSDAFLLLMMKAQGLSDTKLILVYVFYNLVYAAFSFPMGALADKLGSKPTFILGLLLFAAVYAIMPFTHNIWIFGLLFFAFGLFAAATDGVGKAWITNVSSKETTATAIGFFTGMSSLVTLAASTVAGVLWNFGAPSFMFAFSATGAVLVVLYFLFSGIKGKTS